jgi:arylformamidase
MPIVDISQEVSAATAVWPGDTPFATRRVMSIAAGCSCNVGTVTMSLHTGTHADAPVHYLEGDLGAGEVDLEPYLGPARVVEVNPKGAIGVQDLEGRYLHGAERVLLKTGTAPDATIFPLDFASLSPEAATFLADLGVRLVGIDTPSVDSFDSKTLPTHKVLRARRVAVLENLNLSDIESGDYQLIALPLRLKGLDASPVRAVLIRP